MLLVPQAFSFTDHPMSFVCQFIHRPIDLFTFLISSLEPYDECEIPQKMTASNIYNFLKYRVDCKLF